MKSLLVSLIFIPGFLQAQRWHVNVTGGLSNYSGDLQGKPYTFDQSNFAFGAGIQYDITRNFSAISNISYMKVSASDQFNNPDLVFRNLSFQSHILEWNVLGEYTFLDITKNKFSPFLFAGIAIFGNINGVALATVFPVIVGIWIGYWSLRKYENFKLPQILTVGYAEMRVLLREKLNLKKSFLP